MRNNGFKLIHVTKSYYSRGAVQSDNFWKKETKVGNIRIIWICKFTIRFEGGFEFRFDFDFWFEFSKLMQNLRGDLYRTGFPYTSRPRAKKFGKREATRALNQVKNTVKKKIKRAVGGWGKHGIKNDVVDRKSIDICHRKEFAFSSISELEKLRNS
ncbi:hypothetical protein AKJ53_01730, partial [candidate division MSBL1 archaeon SCGC-AAA382F02]